MFADIPVQGFVMLTTLHNKWTSRAFLICEIVGT